MTKKERACPTCNSPVSRLRKGGFCPHCRAKLFLVNGIYLTPNQVGRATKLLGVFESLRARQLGVESFSIPSWKTRAKNLAMAEKLCLLAGDIETAERAMRLLFEDERCANWKQRIDLSYCFKEFPAAVALARKNMAAQAEADEREAHLLASSAHGMFDDLYTSV